MVRLISDDLTADYPVTRSVPATFKLSASIIEEPLDFRGARSLEIVSDKRVKSVAMVLFPSKYPFKIADTSTGTQSRYLAFL